MKDTDGINLVTDDNTGGHYVCHCKNCDAVFNSGAALGGEPIADSGDFGDCYCPVCGEVDPDDCDNPNLVWNIQQVKINSLVSELYKTRDVLRNLIDTYDPVLGFNSSWLAAAQEELKK